MTRKNKMTITGYTWSSFDEIPTQEVRWVRRRLIQGTAPKEDPEGIASGPSEEPFPFSQAMRLLTQDISIQMRPFRHLDVNRILFGFCQARRGTKHGLQARVTPLRFAGGEAELLRKQRRFRVQGFRVQEQEILYLVEFCLPRYLDQPFEQKLITLFHELHHIGPNFDGDLRRHGGRYQFHTSSQKEYDLQMAQWVRDYLTLGACPEKYDFLRLNFDQLREKHRSILGHRLPRPKVIPV